jgi:hypothetical protein
MMYEDSLRLPQAVSDIHWRGAFLIALILSVGSAQVLAATETDQSNAPPDVIHFCWTNCFSLTFGNGRYTRTDGADETWTVERFTPTSLILHRHSTPAAWNGFSADVTYAGQISDGQLINVTVNGRGVAGINMAWGAALETLPGSNAERDQRLSAQQQKQAPSLSTPPVTDAGPAEDIDMRAADAPPPLLTEEQPACAEDGDLWTPGYWAWGGGYYWVPGAWIPPPRVGMLWTPGYWGYAGAIYVFHAGYWGPHVGFYGGINYGFGYPGVGFAGGRWVGNSFAYNRSVNNVDVRVIHNSYSETVVNNVSRNTVSYNGGPGGIAAGSTAQERAAAAEPHFPSTARQRQISQQAAGNPALMARANDGHAVLAAPHIATVSSTPAARAPGFNAPPAARAPSTGASAAHGGLAPRAAAATTHLHSAPIAKANTRDTAAQPAKPKPADSTTTAKPQPHPKR